MRIAVLCTDIGIRVPGDKGASMHLASITSAFAAAGHDVQLIAVAGDGPEPTAPTDLLLLPHPGRASGLQHELTKIAFVEQVADDAAAAVHAFAPDVIYERLSLFGSAGVRLAASIPGCLHVLEVNALIAQEEAAWRGLHLTELATAVERRVLEQTDLAIAVSDEVARKVMTTSPGSRCAVVENGAEVERFRNLPERTEARRTLRLPASAVLVCFVGALRPWHGVDVAITAVARTRHLGLLVVGDGPVRGELERHAENLGVADRVHFLGQLRHDDVARTLAASDAAVAPYPALDQFSFSPLKLYEYLAAGIPVVASAIGQIPAVLDHGRWGTLVPPGDADALAAALVQVTSDPLASARARGAREYALEHHGWDDRARRIIAEMELTRAMA